MIHYTIQPTRAGDYIVRNPMGNEMARFPTEAQAQEWTDDRSAQDATAQAQREQAAADQDAWDKRDAGLWQAQLRWQRWRSWLYAEMRATERHLSGLRRASANWPDSPTAARKYEQMAEDQAELDAAAALYEEAVSLDTRIKTARVERNAPALAAALEEAASMIPRIKAALHGAALPEEPPPVSETSRPTPNISAVLTPEQVEFIEARSAEFGGKSGVVREALRRMMAQEP